MTPDGIIFMARQAGVLSEYQRLERFAHFVAAAERERLFNELMEMHEKAKHSHNAYLHAVVTLREKAQLQGNQAPG